MVFIRKIFYRWMFPAAVILPAWLLIGWAAFGTGGWAFLLVLIGAVVLAVGLAIVAGLIRARSDVRAASAVSGRDALVLAIWHALIIALGFQTVASSWLMLGVVAGLIGGFWYAIVELFRSAKRGLDTVLRDAERQAYNGGGATLPDNGNRAPRGAGGGGFAASDDPNVIIVRESPREP